MAANYDNVDDYDYDNNNGDKDDDDYEMFG